MLGVSITDLDLKVQNADQRLLKDFSFEHEEVKAKYFLTGDSFIVSLKKDGRLVRRADLKKCVEKTALDEMILEARELADV